LFNLPVVTGPPQVLVEGDQVWYDDTYDDRKGKTKASNVSGGTGGTREQGGGKGGYGEQAEVKG